MSDFFDVVRRRRSIRKFRPDPVSDGLLTQVLEAANQAPSAGNAQAYRIFVVKQYAVRQRLSRAAGNQSCVASAPVVLVFCADPAPDGRSRDRPGTAPEVAGDNSQRGVGAPRGDS